MEETITVKHIAIGKYLDERGNVHCKNCKEPIYRYYFKYYPKVEPRAFSPINIKIKFVRTDTVCPLCLKDLFHKECK